MGTGTRSVPPQSQEKCRALASRLAGKAGTAESQQTTQLAAARPFSPKGREIRAEALKALPGGAIVDVFQKCREFTRAQDCRDAGVYLMYREIGSAQDLSLIHI